LGRGDAFAREALAHLPVGVEFGSPAMATAPPLSEATVAIVTTSALTRPGDPWQAQSHEFRIVDLDDPVIMGHDSTNLDRVGFAADRNVVFPIDRLREMEAEGCIGRVAPRHLAFLGSTFDLSTFVLDTGPAAAKVLQDDGVDVVLLTPV
jgi:D-proline reductase (dithiol) PrdB